MFNIVKRSLFHKSIAETLRKAEKVQETPEWRQTSCTAVGGLLAVGFLDNAISDPDKLLIIGNAGQTLLDCASGERLYRNSEEDGFDTNTLTAWDLRSNGCSNPVTCLAYMAEDYIQQPKTAGQLTKSLQTGPFIIMS